MSTKPQLLILSTWFAPAFRAGGPVTSLRNLVLSLEKDLDITVLTGARDLGEREPLHGVPCNTLQAFSQSQVVYTTSVWHTLRWCLMLRKRKGSVYYNDIYSLRFFLLPRILLAAWGQPKQHILALRGMLLPGALAIKVTKKKLFLSFFGGFHRIFPTAIHYTSEAERDAAEERFPRCTGRVIQNLPSAIQTIHPKIKEPGRLVLCFLGRVVPIKNLEWLLSAASHEDGVELLVYGILEDVQYWQQLQRDFAAKKIPLHYHSAYHVGDLPSILSTVDMVYCPSQSENYGHAIVQGLCHGVPVVATQNAPWGKLEEYQAGVLVDPERGDAARLQPWIQASEADFIPWRQGAHTFAQEIIHNTHTKPDYLDFFTADSQSA